ncbi:hypothetical protein BKA67DRAFT_584209 [Truncatella angustata]|uniref:Uncharacterized protein n=1 Tax=Truncatella angustata TaxID=152316 RepID=A0A9P8RIC1_9PEZI|nr:uncharacterized protein BKA67DRAFT_584209 [Truncatella angustata]KAH6646407.1 hypothetical protein BKA67DRAFT_584209 [Truncatella angustata]
MRIFTGLFSMSAFKGTWWLQERCHHSGTSSPCGSRRNCTALRLSLLLPYAPYILSLIYRTFQTLCAGNGGHKFPQHAVHCLPTLTLRSEVV